MSEWAKSGEWTAQYPFLCGCCDASYPAGTVAVYGPDGGKYAVHCHNRGNSDLVPYVLDGHPEHRSNDTMPTDEEMAEARSKMCRSCFLVHAGECA